MRRVANESLLLSIAGGRGGEGGGEEGRAVRRVRCERIKLKKDKAYFEGGGVRIVERNGDNCVCGGGNTDGRRRWRTRAAPGLV